MESTDSDAEITRDSKLSPAERITELNKIESLVSALLSSASQATGILAGEKQQSLEEAQEEFKKHTSQYFSTLSTIEVGLRRQVYALEEANLIKPGDEKDTRRGKTLSEDAVNRRAGGGPLDNSWLNARARDTNEQAIKEEILDQVSAFLKKAKQERVENGSEADDPMNLET